MRLTDKSNIGDSLSVIGLTEIEYEAFMGDLIDMLFENVDVIESCFDTDTRRVMSESFIICRMYVRAVAEMLAANYVTRTEVLYADDELCRRFWERIELAFDKERHLHRHWVITSLEFWRSTLPPREIYDTNDDFKRLLNDILLKTAKIMDKYHANFRDDRWTEIIGRPLNQPYLQGYVDHYDFVDIN